MGAGYPILVVAMFMETIKLKKRPKHVYSETNSALYCVCLKIMHLFQNVMVCHHVPFKKITNFGVKSPNFRPTHGELQH